MRLILPLAFFALVAYIGGNALVAGVKVTKGYSDRMAETICKVSYTAQQSCR